MNSQRTNELQHAEGVALAEAAVKLLLEKLAEKVTMFDVANYTSITEFYVNATGRSLSHVAALADELVDNFELRGMTANRVEGKKGNTWILVDFGSLIVNIFDSEGRSFYNFDRLLPAESEVNIDSLIKEVDEKFKLK
jgi:ribosome-associated protein